MNKKTLQKSVIISPWEYDVSLESPDGLYKAIYSSSEEVCMGGPTKGCIEIWQNDNYKQTISMMAGASMAWSNDSNYFAFSEWHNKKNQRICFLSTLKWHIYRDRPRFRVLEFHDFSEGSISGIDSPAHKPKVFSLALECLRG